MTSAPAVVKQVAELSCVYCGEEHDFDNCPRNPASVNYVDNFNRQLQNNPYLNTYNPGWKQHPNFSWSNQNRNALALNGQNRNTQPPGFHQQSQGQKHISQDPITSLEALIKEYIAKNEAIVQSQAVSLRNLENQMGQLATAMSSRTQGSLPSNTKDPMREGKKHYKFRHPPPFPQRFQKQKQDKQFSKFLEVLKQLHINIPFVEALEQMPNYVKFLKDILARKRRLGEFETVALTQKISHMLQSKIPTKVKDPRSFTIHCSIGTRYTGRALCDLGASMNLTPLSVFKQLGVEESRPTIVTLQLANRFHVYPEGKIEDVLVKVDKFIFPVDFIVLDFEADKKVPIILGIPFLVTGKTLIDVQKGELTMRVNDQQVTFNVLEAMKNPDELEDCNFLSVVDFVVADRIDKCCSNEINKVITFEDLEEEDVAANQIDRTKEKQPDRHNRFIEHLNLSDREVKITLPSIESPLSLELKLLPSHLKYVYLDQNNTLPIIISSTLNAGQEQSLIDFLGRYRRAIRWTMADIKGISPSVCMHKVLLEDCHNNSMEHQNSSWVSPFQCVPKKGGITMIANERDELIPTRTLIGWRVYWTLAFELMCDASDHSVGAVLGQRKDKEFYLKIKDRKGTENQVADHLSRLEANTSTLTRRDITETFPDEQLLVVQQAQMLQQSGSSWCQRTWNITKRHEMPLTNILEVEVFDVWGIDFMGLFRPSFGNLYIFVAVDYVSKWVEAAALPTNDIKQWWLFFRKIFFLGLVLLE
ncbi:hypothetical protein KPL71_001111 [Citrus sinensis]|uniref:Uncharacterized protein n=1 Tax=Citrus sinensis TaxID=2711 RepID=A0ACB8NUY6_CITSI|nr:hypothetical protein KPL71_001111 [Citrus sinensis]